MSEKVEEPSYSTNLQSDLKEVGNSVQKQVRNEKVLQSDVWIPVALTFIYIYVLRVISNDWSREEPLATFAQCSVFVPLAASAVYLSSIFIGVRLMKDREPFSVKSYMLIYNLYQTILNGWCVYSFIRELVVHNYPIWGNPLNSTSYTLSFLIWIHYNNKYLEFLDTFFMVIRKKNEQLSFLHVYHHVLLVWAWWFVCRFACGGDAYFGAMANSFIHVVMYSYYFMASLNINCPWKKYITQLQMVQFVVCFAHAFYNMVTGNYPTWLCYIQLYVMVNMFVLFANFYRNAYAAKKNAGTVKPIVGPSEVKQQKVE